MKTLYRIKQIFVLMLCFIYFSCEDFLEIDVPDHKIISETVFNSDNTAKSAMTGVYNELASVFFSSGGASSVTVLAGLSADDITTLRTTNLPYLEFDQHDISADNFRNDNLWSSAYNIIYMTNSLLEGLANSANLSRDVLRQLEGEAKFVRAFTYFYLVNLYGEIPLLLGTDYKYNSVSARNSKDEIYQQILSDLGGAMDLLGNSYSSGERTQVISTTAIALMARVQLYLQNWRQAEELSSEVIALNATYEVLEDLNQVFLADSREAIWQLSPEGRGGVSTNTNEGANFIINPYLLGLSHFKLSNSFVGSFENEDKRLENWIGFHQRAESFYPLKYKILNSSGEVFEYSMVMRLAEQYLIRAEARAMQDDIIGAITDLDVIRSRAGLEAIADTRPQISKEELLNLIIDERKRELFTEWGHRWLDLKRTSRAREVLGITNPFWEDSDLYYPIPEKERMKNPNLTQNPGY